MHRYKKLLICKATVRAMMLGEAFRAMTCRATRHTSMDSHIPLWCRRLALALSAGRTRRTRRTRRSRRTRWARGARRARRTRRTCWGRRTRGCGTRKAWPFATPVGDIFRVLIERWRATLPRWEVAAGVEQIAGDVDLLAFLGVGQTLHWRLGMSLDGDDDRHRQSDEHPHKTAIDHEHSFMQGPCQD
jgi:hypothetical protein